MAPFCKEKAMKLHPGLFTSVAVAALALSGTIGRAADTCSAYPPGTADKIESKDVEAKFGPVPAPAKDLHFAYVTKTLINEFWQGVAAGIQAEAAKHNIKVDIQAAKDEASLSEQLNLAQTILSKKPDALLLSPQSDSNLAPVVEAAKAANIPTVIIDDARTEGASTYVGTDQVAIGSKAADFLHKTYPNGGKVAQIEGQAGSPNARKRIQGFTTTLKTYPNLQLVASQPGDWDRLTAMNATSNILRENPDLIGVYANNDGMAFGVFEAVDAAKKANQVAVVGTDGIPEAKKSIADGQMKATVAEFPYDEGVLGVQMALRLIGCQAIPPWVVSPQATINADNVKDFPNPPPFKP
jgi:ribose transport system substrate-binding protein